jgi:hypothetical protein
VGATALGDDVATVGPGTGAGETAAGGGAGGGEPGGGGGVGALGGGTTDAAGLAGRKSNGST